MATSNLDSSPTISSAIAPSGAVSDFQHTPYYWYLHELLQFILVNIEEKNVEALLEGLIEARKELKPMLSQSNERLRDLIFLDIALDSTVRTAVERGYEELRNASPENKSFSKPTILVAKSVRGEEEIPEGVVAVLTPDMHDVLSHVSVRARNNKVFSPHALIPIYWLISRLGECRKIIYILWSVEKQIGYFQPNQRTKSFIRPTVVQKDPLFIKFSLCSSYRYAVAFNPAGS